MYAIIKKHNVVQNKMLSIQFTVFKVWIKLDFALWSSSDDEYSSLKSSVRMDFKCERAWSIFVRTDLEKKVNQISTE